MAHRMNLEKLRLYLNQACKLDGSLSVKKFKDGQSNPTFHLKIGQKDLVLRKKPDGKLLPGAHQVGREYRVMKALHSTGFPVPQVLAHCTDSDILGTDFFIMDFVEGRIHFDGLPGKDKNSTRECLFSAVETLAQLHSIQPDEIGLGDYGKKTSFCERQVKTFSRQYEVAKQRDIPEMNQLAGWLRNNLPPEPDRVSIVHGDYSSHNIMFHPLESRVRCILDWELSTLGHPLTDLAYFCMMIFHLPPQFKHIYGNLDTASVIAEREIVDHYCKLRKITSPPQNWNFFVALSCFRMASIVQGVYTRFLQGNSSQKTAELYGYTIQPLAAHGLQIAKQGWKDDSNKSGTNSIVLSPSTKGKSVLDKVNDFIQNQIIPNEKVYYEFLEKADNKWCVVPIVEELKAKAKADGLWNLFLPGISGLSNVDYAHIAEQLGKYVFASEVFNCSAPDTGNMEVLHLYGDDYQKKTFLQPLLEGEIRSAFCMTEPAVASSDATNMALSIIPDGDFYIVNGRKWWSSGAGDPRCKIGIVMGRTEQSEFGKHAQHSMIVVPFDLPGVKVLRPMCVFGFEDYPHGHMEVDFDNVRVPKCNLILGEGRGFEIAQGRLGPGRIHHCMRSIGAAERCLEMYVARGLQRTTFGKKLIEHQVNQHHLAQCRIGIEQARLLVLHTALTIDTNGAKAARKQIAMIKVAAIKVFKDVVDKTIQIHGAAGVSQDFPLAAMYTWARSLQFADGPDEVHLDTLAKLEIRDQMKKAKL